MLTAQTYLDLLKRAKDLKVSWVQVADTLIALEATSNRAPDGRTWISFVADISEFSDNQLRRFTRARSFLREAEAEQRGSSKRLSALPFAHVDVLGKIWQLDRKRALELIDRADDAKSFTYVELLKEYQDIRAKGLVQTSPIAAGKHAAQEFIKACGQILMETQLLTRGSLFPKDQRAMLHPASGFEFTNPDYIVRDTSAPESPIIDAIDCYFISGRAQRDALRRKISQVAFESTFFTRFWCLIPPSELAATFISYCNDLSLANVGLLIVDVPKRSCSVLRNPDSKALPAPDRRSLIFSSRGYKRLRPVQRESRILDQVTETDVSASR